ncbi:peptidyl-tRNA hydrolase ArfB [Microbulbifer sp. NBRC 101763]|uniref:alternative ribosome rescue aminoacyl-tRNA hydrolase ArfB n=1 Tax=Microbulbifer TaxID=48073 RepID=UPI00036994A7|nr:MULTISPECIES: alternative ribosome rescue aminoacyl-tRNA hydrolase ArfB [Microbulbifer]WHI52095.1 alternative ribosome rescue aminoacyl-tRNA hydrolase ArfB [Microbulbifer sp. MLAF003]
MLGTRRRIQIPQDEIQLSAVRSQGAGGQNVNKVSSAIHLRFNIYESSLPENIKQRLLQIRDRRISSDGIVVIKAQTFRTQEKNREDALSRLQQLIEQAAEVPKRRIPTKPSRGAKERRLQSKNRRSQVKAMRGKIKE